VYGQQNDNFKEFVVASQWSAAHKDRNASYWLELIDEIFNNHLSVAVEAKPSLKLSTDYTEKEEARTKKQIEDLGPDGIKKKMEELEAALESQTLPSDEILTKIPLGDVEKIQFRSLNSYNRTLNPEKLFNFSGIPFKIHVDDVKSKFVTIYVYIDLEG
jgi:Zn-dependent M16 (insulinase) family peptidase